jgi:hypothetical protein
MQDWLGAPPVALSPGEQYLFDETWQRGATHLTTWSEEDLKMKFLSPVLQLGGLTADTFFTSSFDKSLAATVQGHALSVKADFVIGSGVLDYMQKPYFHFQKYTSTSLSTSKPDKNPSGDSMAQLLQAFLIAWELNQDNTPLYGCEVNGASWKFVIFQDQTYCVSKSLDSSDKDDLLRIIAILRCFIVILKNKLTKKYPTFEE